MPTATPCDINAAIAEANAPRDAHPDEVARRRQLCEADRLLADAGEQTVGDLVATEDVHDRRFLKAVMAHVVVVGTATCVGVATGFGAVAATAIAIGAISFAALTARDTRSGSQLTDRRIRALDLRDTLAGLTLDGHDPATLTGVVRQACGSGLDPQVALDAFGNQPGEGAGGALAVARRRQEDDRRSERCLQQARRMVETVGWKTSPALRHTDSRIERGVRLLGFGGLAAGIPVSWLVQLDVIGMQAASNMVTGYLAGTVVLLVAIFAVYFRLHDTLWRRDRQEGTIAQLLEGGCDEQTLVELLVRADAGRANLDRTLEVLGNRLAAG